MASREDSRVEERGTLDFTLRDEDGWRGALLAAAIWLLWFGALCAWLVVVPWRGALWALAPLAILIQTFLYTGLFITAHDAMHGTACWTHPRVNRFIGRVTLLSYALFPFGKLLEAHRAHHDHPGERGEDPDFHPDPVQQGRGGVARWYVRFLWHYIGLWQFLGMAVVFNVLSHLFGVSEPKLILFWVLPALLSTLQLFYFGTYLPHRVRGEFRDGHRARSNDYAPWLSLMTCYHFGYHWEHHAAPHAPWWRLPELWRARERADRAHLGAPSTHP